MANPISVRIVAPGSVRQALGALIRQQSDMRMDTGDADVSILFVADGWRDELEQRVGADRAHDGPRVVVATIAKHLVAIQAASLGVRVFVDLADAEHELLDGIRCAVGNRVFWSRSFHPLLLVLQRRVKQHE